MAGGFQVCGKNNGTGSKQSFGGFRTFHGGHKADYTSSGQHPYFEGAAKRLKVPKEKVFTNLHKYGNISSASIPLGLDEAIEKNCFPRRQFNPGRFWRGLTWGSAIIRWNK